jgi:hypothetical protein
MRTARREEKMNTYKLNVKENTEKNPPEKKFRAGPEAATIWVNTTIKDGKTVEYRTVSFERSYKDKNDSWQTTHSLRMGDLPRAALVLSKAFEYLALAPSASEEE